MYFKGDNGCQNHLVFSPMLSSLILDSIKKVTNCILTRISSEIIKTFDTNLELPIDNLPNGRVILKSSNSILVQKSSSSLYSNFILNFYIVYELNDWPRNPTNYSPMKFFVKYGFTPYKAVELLQGMELQEKEAQKD